MKSIAAALLILSVISAAPDDALADRIQPGTVELTTDTFLDFASYSVDGDDAGSITQLQISAGVGYFATSMVELVGAVLLDHSSVDPEGEPSFDATQFGVLGSLMLNIDSGGSAIPFITAGFGLLGNSGNQVDDEEATLILPRLGGGVRFLVGNSASINLSAIYMHILNSQGVDDLNANELVLGVGLSIFLAGGPAGL